MGKLRCARSAGIVLPALLVVACGPVDGGGDEKTSTAEEAIIGGVRAHFRKEIGDYNGVCTATMISPGWIVMAAHCGFYMDASAVPGGSGLVFRTSADGVHFGDSGGQTVPVTHQFSFANDNVYGAKDVMIARLGAAVTSPPGIVPTTIATAAPKSGPVTIWGRGCTGWDTLAGSSIMRYFSSTVGARTAAVCPGDSGGPEVIGTAVERGAIFGVSSACQGPIGSCDVFGDPVADRSEIQAIMADWDAHAADDIYATGWCHGPDDRLVFGDVEGHGRPAAICHNRVTGLFAVAAGKNRLLEPSSTSSEPWCNGPNDELAVGDFDGDGRTDLLCLDRATGMKRIDYADSAGRYAGTDWQGASGWCSHSTAELYVGDFNGDGRSDLLCHDTVKGWKWIDYADCHGHFDGITDWWTDRGWCHHPGAHLYTGDADGDGKTDLICHAPSTGALDVDLSDGGSAPFASHNDRSLRGPMPGTTRLFCNAGRLEVADYNGDGRSDLLCYYGANQTWPSLWGVAGGEYTWGAPFGWGGAVRVRRVRAASQPWPMR
jgi:hypothetical protein